MGKRKQRAPDERVYLRGRIWWCWYYDAAGRAVYESTRCRDKAAAEAYAADAQRRAVDPHYAAARTATVATATALLLTRVGEQVRVGKKSAATLLFYKRKTGHLNRLMGGLFLSALSPNDVDAYITARRAEWADNAETRHVSEHTISKELIALRSSLKHARRARIWNGDPAGFIPVAFAPEYKPRETVLTLAQVRLLCEVLEPHRAAWVAFVVATSAELGAMQRAERSDVLEGSVHLRGTKRATRKRDVPLATEWQRSLVRSALIHADGKGGKLFSPWGSVVRDLAAACKRAGCYAVKCPRAGITGRGKCRDEEHAKGALPRVTPNDLRRTTANLLHSAGVHHQTIAPLMGHADTRMLALVYGKLSAQQLGESIKAQVRAHAGISQTRCQPVTRAETVRSRCSASVVTSADALSLMPPLSLRCPTQGSETTG